MSKIGYGVNWLLTRKCNLHCSYCSIVKKSDVYPDSPFQQDVDIEKAKVFIRNLKKHNPDSFHMFLGGEPTMYPHLEELINFCNQEKVLYTIITNMTYKSYSILANLLDKVQYLNGLTFTIDPVLWDDNFDKSDDRYKKSLSAYERFMTFRENEKIKEFVCLVGVDANNIKYLHKICEDLSSKGVWIDLITLETKLNDYYDFASPMDYNLLPGLNKEDIKILQEVYFKAQKGDYLVLAHEMIRRRMIPSLPQHYNCKIENSFDTITIDSDNKFRLCLRIRGTKTPEIDITDILDNNGHLTIKFRDLLSYLKEDKKNYCYGCMWTCPMFGELINDGVINPDDVNHENKIVKYIKN